MKAVPRPPRPGKSLAELKPDKALEWDYERNYPYTPETVAAESKVAFAWNCRVNPDHKWEQAANGRTQGYGCPGCSGQRTFKGSNDLATTHPELCLEWHPENSVTPHELSRGSNYRAKWICSKDRRHMWETTPYERTRANATGCPACAGRMVVVGVNDLVTTHPLLAAQWCIDKNSLRPHEVHPGSSIRAWWKCSLNSSHLWHTKIETRTRLLTGCPYCKERNSSKVEEKLRDSVSQIPLVALVNQKSIALEWNKNRTASIDILGRITNGR
jgi:hypothetical protein